MGLFKKKAPTITDLEAQAARAAAQVEAAVQDLDKLNAAMRDANLRAFDTEDEAEAAKLRAEADQAAQMAERQERRIRGLQDVAGHVGQQLATLQADAARRKRAQDVADYQAAEERMFTLYERAEEPLRKAAELLHQAEVAHQELIDRRRRLGVPAEPLLAGFGPCSVFMMRDALQRLLRTIGLGRVLDLPSVVFDRPSTGLGAEVRAAFAPHAVKE